MPIRHRSSIVHPWRMAAWPIVTLSPIVVGMGPGHDVDDGAVLDVRAAADANPVHVAADDDRHPDAALLADLDVADDLRAVVDERGRVDARKRVAERPEHQRIIAGLSLNSRWR